MPNKLNRDLQPKGYSNLTDTEIIKMSLIIFSRYIHELNGSVGDVIRSWLGEEILEVYPLSDFMDKVMKSTFAFQGELSKIMLELSDFTSSLDEKSLEDMGDLIEIMNTADDEEDM